MEKCVDGFDDGRRRGGGRWAEAGEGALLSRDASEIEHVSPAIFGRGSLWGRLVLPAGATAVSSQANPV